MRTSDGDYTLDDLLELAASDDSGRRADALTGPPALWRLLAWVAWNRNPVVHLRYDSEGDELTAEVLHCNTVADHCVDDLLCLGFDSTDERALPTTLCLLNFRSEPKSNAAVFAHQVLGGLLWQYASELAAAGGGQQDVVLDPHEKTTRLATWNALAAELDLEPAVVAVGLELLPYKLRAVLVDARGRAIACQARHLESMEPGDVVEAANDLARQLVSAAHPHIEFTADRVALGFELGAPVDTSSGIVRFYRKRLFRPDSQSSYRWRREPLGQRLKEATGLHSVVLNDADAHAIYEQWFGVGRTVSRYAVILIREGIGGSAVIADKLFDGPVEIGNVAVDQEGNECDCGNRGCLEVTAGTTGIVTEAKKYDSSIDSIETAVRRINEDPDIGQKVVGAFKAAGYALARGIALLIAMFAPKVMVVYGPEILLERRNGPAAQALMRRMRRFKKYVAHDDFKDCDLVIRTNCDDAGAHGAAVAALQRVFNIDSTAAAIRGL